MPTLADLIAATETQLDAVHVRIVTLRAAMTTNAQQLEQAEARRALLKTRLEALRVLNTEAP